MAYSLNVGDIVEVTYRGTLFGQVVMIVLHYRYTGAAPIANGQGALQVLLTDLQGAGQLRDALLGCMCPEANIGVQRAQVVYPTRQVYLDNNVGIAGTNAGACTTPNVSGVIIKRPDQAGRGRAGSVHVPGTPAASQVGGAWNAGYMATLGNLGDLLNDQYDFSAGMNDATPVIWSRVRPTTPSVVIGHTVNPYVRTMHRRTPLLGI